MFKLMVVLYITFKLLLKYFINCNIYSAEHRPKQGLDWDSKNKNSQN